MVTLAVYFSSGRILCGFGQLQMSWRMLMSADVSHMIRFWAG